MQQAKRFFVAGVVQGVGFRFFTERIARRLALAGYVRNLSDGRVEVYVIGEAHGLTMMEDELKRGPGAAIVSDVETEAADIDPRYSARFSIERGR